VPYSLIVDVIVLGLLVVMIPYIVRLNGRLGMLRRDKAQLEKLAATFTESTRRADESLGGLRTSAENMQRKLDSAQALHDDLAFLLERGEKTADRLEDMIRLSRPDAPPAPDTAEAVAPSSGQTVPASPIATAKRAPLTASPQPSENGENSLRSEAERELLKAIRSTN
jgi:hypothetical protein